MIKNNVYYEWFASITVPNPDQVGYWIDLGADSKGRIIKVYNHDIEKWVVLFDVSKDDYVPPFIGSNGNWWVDNRDTGVKATAETPYIGENDHWFTYDPINKVYVDTGIEARGLSAYDIAVKLGFKGSEQDWIDSLSKASEDAAVAALEAANKANEAADKANQAVEEIEGIVDDAIAATDKAEEIASNPPKIVDNDWWIYDYDTKQYVNTGISAIGDAFTYKKEYPSVEAMEADWGTADVKLGEYVLINTNNVEDPDDAKVYLKTQEGWKFIVDLSGMQGIQGWSAYEVAVKHGFVGTEEEWVQSLKQPALDAAAEALEAKAQVEATEKAVKEAEALRVTAEQGRVSNEATRQANEAIRETQEAAREKNTADAITAVNEAKTAAQQATTNATTAANNANTQANRAKEYADNPPKVGDDGYWYLWDEVNDVYVNTGWPSSGIILKGSLDSPEDLDTIVDPQLSDSYIVGTDLYFWNGTEWVNMGRFQGPQGEPGKDAELSKAAIEAVLVGEVTTHTHDTRYYTKDQTDANIKVVADDLANNYYNKSQVDSKFTSVYIFKGSVDTIEDLPTEGNVIGDVWNVRKNDINHAWTSEGWDALGGTAELASLTANGLMSKEDFAKLQGIEAGAQVNKIETITKRVLLNAVDKNVTIPEDIKISDTEPTEEEIMWLDPSENYDFTFDGYSQAQADELFVKKGAGKGLSTKDYTAEDKKKVTNLGSYVSNATGATADANAVAITLEKKNPTTGTADSSAITIDKATTSKAGVMSAADKTKLDAALTASDNIATATKLATARTIWGQAFDGSANVSGNMTGVGNIAMSGVLNLDNNRGVTVKDTEGEGLGVLNFNATNDLHFGYYTANKGYNTYIAGNNVIVRTVGLPERVRITTDGKVGIGTSAPERILDVAGGVQFKTNIDNVIKIPVKSIGSGHAPGMHFYTNDGSTRIGGIGGYVSNPSSENYRSYVGWGDNPFDLNSSLTVSNSSITYKGNKVWHAGNDGSGSGLDADLLDGYHAGYKNGNLALYINFPKITDLISQGLLRSDYETVGYPTEDFLIALCKWAINNYTDETSHVLLQGEITPAVSGWCVLNLYANDGKDNTTGLPKYCSGQVNLINKSSILFGSYNGTWYYKTLVDTSNLEDTLAYWYENDENNSSTTCATGGNRNVIESLRSKFKRCIAKPYGDDAALISYCNEENSTNWPDGSAIDIVFARKENRMVHFPKYYHKTVERSPGIWRTYISEQQIDSDYIEEPEMLLGTFEAYTNTDGTLLSALGVTSTASQTMATFVSQAKSNGPLWGIGDYRSHATIARMFCAYYKTTNISTSNSAIPCSGGTKRYNYGITGATITLGNRDGKKATTSDTSYYSTNFLGLEDCYYSKWEFVQGINILKGKYVVYDGGSFPDKDVAELEAAGATNIRVVGYEPNPAATAGYNGWIKTVAQGKYGDVLPTSNGGSETTYYSDHSWFNPTANRIFLRSDSSGHGSQCGVFVAAANYASSASWTTIGARLAFYGKIVVVDSDTFKKMQA